MVGLASSSTATARDAVVAATADPDAGVRKSANYLVQRGTANSFGPIGCIHGGSPTEDVDASGRKIRAIYKWDKTVGAGWGPMRDGLQTRIEIDDDAKPAGRDFRVSLIVRNVDDKPVLTPSQTHPIRHFKVLTKKKLMPLKIEQFPDPLPPKTIEPGRQVIFWSFVPNDYFELESPGVYEVWLPETYVALPPRSNRVRLQVEPSNEPRDPRPAEEEPGTPLLGARAGQEIVCGKTTNAVKRLKANMSVYDFSLSLRYWPGPREGVPSRGEGISSVPISLQRRRISTHVRGRPTCSFRNCGPNGSSITLPSWGFSIVPRRLTPKRRFRWQGFPKARPTSSRFRSTRTTRGIATTSISDGTSRCSSFLDGFRKGLVGEEAKAMDKVLAQLEPERRRWQAAEETEARPAGPRESADQLAATGKRSLDEQLADAKRRLAAILPDTMTISRAEVMQARGRSRAAAARLACRHEQSAPILRPSALATVEQRCVSDPQCRGAHLGSDRPIGNSSSSSIRVRPVSGKPRSGAPSARTTRPPRSRLPRPMKRPNPVVTNDR